MIKDGVSYFLPKNPGKRAKPEEQPFLNLAHAVVIQAAEDYGNALRGYFSPAKKNQRFIEECLTFFEEECEYFCNIPGHVIKEMVDKRVKEMGEIKPGEKPSKLYIRKEYLFNDDYEGESADC